jgi:hypothetical protein
MRRALLVVTPLLVTGCTFMGEQRTVDGSSVEKAIRRAVIEQGNQVASMHCPTGQKAKKGVTFDCTGVINGTNVVAHVTLTDPTPHFEYRLEYKP